MKGKLWFILLGTALVFLGIGLSIVFRPIEPVVRAAPTLIVLGAAEYNGYPSPMFKGRLDQAFKLYKRGGVEKIIVTGGIAKGEKWSEGNVGRLYLISLGVPRKNVVAERASHSTLQNLQNARHFLSSHAPVTLVTDEIHAPRALAVALSLGLNANASPNSLEGNTPYLKKYRNRERLLLLVEKLLGKWYR